MKTFKSILISLALFAVSFSFVAAANYDSVAGALNCTSVTWGTTTVGQLCSTISTGTCASGETKTITGVATDTAGSGCVCTCSGSAVTTIQTKAGLSTQTVPTIIGNVIKVILGLSGTVALIFVIVGGVKWMTAKGDATKTGDARKFMVSGMIGIIIIAAAYAITNFVLQQIVATV